MNPEITPSPKCLAARHDFQNELTGANVSSWNKKYVKHEEKKGWYDFAHCSTEDGVNGVFITAHNYEVCALCKQEQFKDKEFVVANTCMFEQGIDKGILSILSKYNKDAKLWFAEQEVVQLSKQRVIFVNQIESVGAFGFATSKSERKMFQKRNEGLLNAIHCAFYEVSLAE